MEDAIDNLKRTIGYRIKLGREALGMTQEEFSEVIGRSVPAVSNLERGVSLPPLDLLLKIADVTGQKLPGLLHDIDNKQPWATTRRELELVKASHELSEKDADFLLAMARFLRDRSSGS